MARCSTADPAARRRAVLLLIAGLASGCAGPQAPSDPDTAVLALPEPEARARLDQGLRLQGIVPLVGPSSPGPIEAVGTGAATRGWADCPTIRLSDPSRRTNRSTPVAANDVTTRVSASFQAMTPTQTQVAIRAEQTGLYVNPFTNTTQRAPCPSTGVLERSLLDALKL